MILYRALLLMILPWALPIAAAFNSKVRAGLGQRLRRAIPPKWLGREPTIWVHTASGEFEYAKPVIDAWKLAHPEYRIVVSYFTPTFSKSIQSYPNVDWSLPLPLDLPGPTRSWLKRVAPEQIWIARTDVWPEFCHQARGLKIPIKLFAATIHPNNLSVAWRRWLLRWRYSWLSEIHVVSEADRDTLSPISVNLPTLVSGDPRYDQVLRRLAHPKPLKQALAPRSSIPTIVAGSTWGEDERVLITALENLIRMDQIQVVMVPHEPSGTHIAWLEGELARHGLQSQRYSEASSWRSSHVLIVDQTGVLAELYTWGELAFVGGSFKKSVHSVMEPLAAGCMTYVGPHHQNNREALEFKRLGWVHPVSSADELREAIVNLIQNKDSIAPMKDQIRQQVQKRSGASQALARQLERPRL